MHNASESAEMSNEDRLFTLRWPFKFVKTSVKDQSTAQREVQPMMIVDVQT